MKKQASQLALALIATLALINPMHAMAKDAGGHGGGHSGESHGDGGNGGGHSGESHGNGGNYAGESHRQSGAGMLQGQAARSERGDNDSMTGATAATTGAVATVGGATAGGAIGTAAATLPVVGTAQ